jgi:phage-related protein (TIGR01555 family)
MELKIHASRLVLFDGAHVPTRTGWGDSVLQYCWEPIRQAESTMANIMALIGEAKLDVISVPDLATMLSTASGVKKVQERFIAANSIKSILGVTLIGSGESWERKQISFDQLPALANQFLQNCASAAKMPVTRLLGQSPAGLGSTGEGEARQYYDMINGRQETGIRTALSRFDAHLIAHAGANLAPSDYIWNPLYQMSEPDAAAAAKLRAETSAIYKESGLIPTPELQTAVRAQITSHCVYPGLDEAD